MKNSYSLRVVLMLSLFAVPGLFVAGCDPGEEVEMSVDHYKQPCFGMFKTLCMRVDDGDGFGNFYDNIKGFEFEWGYNCRLRVLKQDVRNPPADGSSVKYTLEEVLEKTPVAPGVGFQLLVEPASDPELSISGPAGGTLIDGTPFTCVSSEACSRIGDALELGQDFTVEFAYGTADGTFFLEAQAFPE